MMAEFEHGPSSPRIGSPRLDAASVLSEPILRRSSRTTQGVLPARYRELELDNRQIQNHSRPASVASNNSTMSSSSRKLRLAAEAKKTELILKHNQAKLEAEMRLVELKLEQELIEASDLPLPSSVASSVSVSSSANGNTSGLSMRNLFRHTQMTSSSTSSRDRSASSRSATASTGQTNHRSSRAGSSATQVHPPVPNQSAVERNVSASCSVPQSSHLSPHAEKFVYKQSAVLASSPTPSPAPMSMKKPILQYEPESSPIEIRRVQDALAPTQHVSTYPDTDTRVRIQEWADRVPVSTGATVQQWTDSGPVTASARDNSTHSRHMIKPLELPKFSGRQQDYVKWKQRFMRLVHDDRHTSEDYKLARLREALEGGDSEELVANVLDGPGAYCAVLKELETWFGGSDRELERQQRELLALPRVTNERDTDGLQSLAVKLRNLLINMSTCRVQPSRDMYLSVTQKLPRSMLSRYMDNHDDSTSDVAQLSTWLIQRVHCSRRVDQRLAPNVPATATSVSAPKSVKTERRPHYQESGGRSRERTFLAKPVSDGKEKPVCPKCSQRHELKVCPEFKGMSVRDRWDLVKPTAYCINCLETGHRSGDCSMDKCTSCGLAHHSLLHYSKKPKAATPKSADQAEKAPKATRDETLHASSATPPTNVDDDQYDICFMTVPAVVSCGNHSVECVGMLDTGSTCSYISESVAKQLMIKSKSQHFEALVIGGQSVSGLRRQARVTIGSADGGSKEEVTAWVLPQVTKSTTMNTRTAQRTWPHLQDVPLASLPPGREVDLLIGLDAIDLHRVMEERSGGTGAPIARLTPLGWTVMGPTTSAAFRHATHHVQEASAEDTLKADVEWLCAVERVGEEQSSSTLTQGEQEAVQKTDESLSYSNGRFSVGIPWISDDNHPHITSNRKMAEQRLRTLEASLARRPDVSAAYSQVMTTHLQKGYISEVSQATTDTDDSQQWYLPHFPVVKKDRATTKVRVVYDAAAEANGTSINKQMYTGPKTINDLVDVLLRFCSEPVALVADVSEMFLQVELAPKDRRYHRFLWRMQPNEPVKTYEFNRLVFGIAASPYLACRMVRETVERFGSAYTTATCTMVKDDFYVDDLLASTSSVVSAQTQQTESQQLLAHGSFHLRKWRSNEPAALEKVPEGDRAPEPVVGIGTAEQQNSATKTLGVAWDSRTDEFLFNYDDPKPTTLTKRKVLSRMASLFDPRGQLAPFSIRAKVNMQSLWLLGLKWDEPLPPDEEKKWRKWFAELPELAIIRAPRCFKEPKHDATTATTSVHIFTDASEHAIAAVGYICNSYPDGTVRSTLAFAKAKPAPTKKVTIPRLELRAAALGIRVSGVIANALGIPTKEHRFWTDSMNVVYWVRSHSKRFKTEVANRIADIQKATDGLQWHHVPGKINPADKPSRGMSASELGHDTAWWEGPEFLKQSSSLWPITQLAVPPHLPEEKKQQLTTLATDHQPDVNILSPERYSSFEHLSRVTAWCRRFANNCRRPDERPEKATTPSVAVRVNSSGGIPNKRRSQRDREADVPELSAKEVSRAQRYLVSKAQQEVYPNAFKQLRAKQPVPPSDPLYKLSPKLDSEEPPLLVVDGRLKYSEHLPQDIRRPVILPPKHPITNLIVDDADRSSNHAAGAQQLLSNLRAKYWVVNGLNTVKSRKHECVKCKRLWATRATQIMGPMPDVRTSGDGKPFTNVGVDYAGPFLTTHGRGRALTKRYVCLFTCLVTRGCHLEIVYSLDTDGFLMAFVRFVKRRGTPSTVVSDNGTNFVAGERELREAVDSIDRQKTAAHLASKGTQLVWKFNPPRAPHHGGVFEVMVRLMKKSLQHVLAQAKLTDEELHTALVQAEWTLNTRPITMLSTDPQDLEPLTPLHFMVGHVEPPLALEQAADQEPSHPRHRWTVVQECVRNIWKRWLKEYVPTLNVRQRWWQRKRNIMVGDIVLNMDENTPRGRWPLARVSAVHPGVDGEVRVVDVRVNGKTYRRPITRLVPLELD